jgi:hypothetical protein
VGDLCSKAHFDCEKLFNESLEAAATRFIPTSEGISGTITASTTDPTYLYDEVDIPIDAHVLHFTEVDNEVDDSGDQS